MHVQLRAIGVTATTLFAIAAQAQDLTVRIGHVAQTSGFLAGFGKNTENGARMAVDELNAKAVSIGGRKARFELVTEDDKSDPKQAGAVAQTLVDARVNGVVGHMFSSTSIAASQVYCAAGIPQISPAATATELTRGGCKSAFRVVPDDTRMGVVLARYAVKEMHVVRVAVIEDYDAAIEWGLKAHAANPTWYARYTTLAVAYAMKGEREKATAAAEAAFKADPRNTVSGITMMLRFPMVPVHPAYRT